MKFVKNDFIIIKEAEANGYMASMTGTLEPKRTKLNDELSAYFRKNVPSYLGSIDEEECEDMLFRLNDYIEENKIDKQELDFPLTSGTDVHLLPITDNLELKVLIADEYYGDGDYSKYIMMDFFLMNDNTTTNDVDALVDFLKKYIL